MSVQRILEIAAGMTLALQLKPLLKSGLEQLLQYYRVRKLQYQYEQHNQWLYEEFPSYFDLKPFPPEAAFTNVLMLCHGKTHPLIARSLFQYHDSNTRWYLVDQNASECPDIVADLSNCEDMNVNPLCGLPNETFDKIVIPHCECCVGPLFQDPDCKLWKLCHRLLKSSGDLVILCKHGSYPGSVYGNGMVMSCSSSLSRSSSSSVPPGNLFEKTTHLSSDQQDQGLRFVTQSQCYVMNHPRTEYTCVKPKRTITVYRKIALAPLGHETTYYPVLPPQTSTTLSDSLCIVSDHHNNGDE